MNQFTYENIGTKAYLVYGFQEDDIVDSMSLGMIINNEISGLAPVFYTQMDEHRYLKYDISGRVSMDQFFYGSVTKKRIISSFSGIAKALMAADDYMIDTKKLLLDTELIFVDVTTCSITMICLPLENGFETTDINAFFKNILVNTQFDSGEDCEYVGRILNFLNSHPTIDMTEFLSMLEETDSVPNKGGNRASSPMKKDRPLNVVSPVKEVVPVKNLLEKEQKPAIEKQSAREEQRFVSPADQPFSKNTVQNETEEEPVEQVSLIYLLRHFDKETMAAYKAGKGKKQPKKAPKKGKENAVAFEVPGQENGYDMQQWNQQIKEPDTSQPKRPAQPEIKEQVQAKGEYNTQNSYAVSANTGMPYSSQNSGSEPPADFGGTTYLNEEMLDGTIDLKTYNMQLHKEQPYLVHKRTGDKIQINKEVFRIGKEKNYVDYCISGNPVISRAHAILCTKNGQYTLMDTNSKNHTFLNDNMLTSNVEVRIQDGDILRFANEEFEFKIL